MEYTVAQLKTWLAEHGKLKDAMETADNYYIQDNQEISERKKLMGIVKKDKEGNSITSQVEDPYASNEKLPSGFLKQQVMQKVNYLINENITLSDNPDEIWEVYPNWTTDLKKLSKKVSRHIYGAWQFYLENGKAKYKYIDGLQIYPVFVSNQETPDLIIRHYTTMGGIEKAIIYDNKTETHFKRGKKDTWEPDKVLPIIKKSKILADETVEEQAIELSQPPFAICFNNDEWQTDLQPIKAWVDIYDKVISDLANNIIDFQEVYRTLKNFGGQDLQEFNDQLKKLKVVPIAEDGEVTDHLLEVPVEAKKIFLEMVRKNIFEFGMAVDVQNIALGNVTMVAIQSMYENLNMKASDFETELQDFWSQVIKLTNEFNSIAGNPTTFENRLVMDRSMISNVNEVYERLSKFIGIIPNQILFRLLPGVDEEEAMDLLDAERTQLTTQLLDDGEE